MRDLHFIASGTMWLLSFGSRIVGSKLLSNHRTAKADRRAHKRSGKRPCATSRPVQ